MAHPLQRIYPRSGTMALSFVRRPASALGAWDQIPAIFTGTNARYQGPLPGSVQQSIIPSFAAVPNGTTKNVCCVQVLSDPLKQQMITAGTWSVAFGAQLANAGATFTWGGKAALYVVAGDTGERRGTIFNITAIGSAGRTVTAERTCYAAVSGAACAIQTGDYLSLELGMAVTNAAAGLAPQARIFTDGLTAIGADAAATTDAQALLIAPAPLPLSLPQAGEQPEASVSHAQAFQLLIEHWPPNSASLYDLYNSDATINHYLHWLADALKIYGYDQVDRICREVSPLSCVELLPAWESLLGITYTTAAQVGLSIADRRAAVLARLRETGPLTLFNAAAVIASMAGYVAPALPEIIEITNGDLLAPNAFTETISIAVPTDTAVADATNLVRLTPVLLDGGHCQNAGAQLTMLFSATDTEAIHVRLTAPDGTYADRTGGPSLNNLVVMRMADFAGCAVHGAWKLNVWRDVGSPVNTLVTWILYAAGQGFGGRGQAHWNWSVYLDSSHRADRRAVQDYLDRATQAYARSWFIYDKTSQPGTDNHRAGWFIPGT